MAQLRILCGLLALSAIVAAASDSVRVTVYSEPGCKGAIVYAHDIALAGCTEWYETTVTRGTDAYGSPMLWRVVYYAQFDKCSANCACLSTALVAGGAKYVDSACNASKHNPISNKVCANTCVSSSKDDMGNFASVALSASPNCSDADAALVCPGASDAAPAVPGCWWALALLLVALAI